jgi:hypothetical protein
MSPIICFFLFVKDNLTFTKYSIQIYYLLILFLNFRQTKTISTMRMVKYSGNRVTSPGKPSNGYQPTKASTLHGKEMSGDRVTSPGKTPKNYQPKKVKMASIKMGKNPTTMRDASTNRKWG